MNLTRHQGWKTVHSIIGNALRRPDAEGSQLMDWLNFQWRLIVGEDLIPLTQIKSLSAKTLVVIVSDTIWLPALSSLRKNIITKINQRAESVLVNRIVFQEGPIINSVIKNTTEEKKRRLIKQKQPVESKSMLEDESLRAMLNRIGKKLHLVL